MSKPIQELLYEAMSGGDLEMSKRLIDENPGLVDLKTPFGSWLHVAAGAGSLNVVVYLVETIGMNIDEKGGQAIEMPVSSAAADGHIEVVKYLLQKGAILDESRPESNPLIAAMYRGHASIVTLLLEHGMDPRKDYTGKSVMDYANEYGWPEVKRILSEAR